MSISASPDLGAPFIDGIADDKMSSVTLDGDRGYAVGDEESERELLQISFAGR
jgi:hypothetical protein